MARSVGVRAMGRHPVTTAVAARADLPSWRGWLHVAAFAAAIPGVAFLLVRADGPSARVAALVYGLGLLAGFGTSAAYHRLARSPRARQVMQRMDHSAIYVLIAATYTPVCLLGLPAVWGLPLLAIVATGAVIGIVLKQAAFHRFRSIEHVLYGGLGWAAALTMPALVRSLSAPEFGFLAAGGLLYTLGVPVLRWNRPNPWPSTFGYHEVWHAATVLAGGCHFVTIGMLVG